MNQRYRRKLPKPLELDSVNTRAAVNFVNAVDNGEVPDHETLQILRDAFLEIFGGRTPTDLFGARLGLVSPKGRPREYGFTGADIVSAYIELNRRHLAERGEGAALERAKDMAATAFVDFEGAADAERSVDRDWRNGRSTAESLTEEELVEILAPYQLTNNPQI